MTSKKVLVMAMVLFCVSGSAFCSGKKVKAKDDQLKDTSVLVEVFVVRVSTEGLIKAGVNPISKGPDGVSILNILWCFANDDYAKVVSGAKVNASHNRQSQLTRHGTRYIAHTSTSSASSSGSRQPVLTTNRRYDSYKVGNEFIITPRVDSDNNITVQARYEEVNVDENKDSGAPLDRSTIEWSGVLSVKSGVPAIVAAVQEDEESISFLILTATIQN